MRGIKYKIVLWDFDGTLANSAQDVWESLDYAANQCGGELPEDFKNNSNLSLPLWKIYENVHPYAGDENLEQFEKQVRIHYRTKNRFEKTVLYTGIEDLLCLLNKKKIKNYIITMKPHQALRNILANKGWNQYFEGAISPDSFFPDAENQMTKSEMISFVIRQTGGEKRDYIYIGDTWTDIEAAHDNQIECIAVTYGDGEAEKLLLKKPEYCARNVREVAVRARMDVCVPCACASSDIVFSYSM